MKPLLVLNSVFIAVLVSSGLFGHWNLALAGNLAMATMLVFTAVGHFSFPTGMAMMMPDFVPLKELLVFLTGIVEIAAAIGLMVPGMRQTAAFFLIIFFLIVLPVNISAAVRNVDFEKADNSGRGVDYLWIRIPMQIVFMLWAWYFGIFLG